MSFAAEIKNIRMKALMTQEEFAKAMEVSFATVNRWETGQAIPRMKAMKNVKSFCANNGISFENAEKEWLQKGLV